MKNARFELARRAELLPPMSGTMAVFGQIEPERLPAQGDLDLCCVSPSFVVHQTLKARGSVAARARSEACDHALVFLPRAKAEAMDLIAAAVRVAPKGWLLIDGQKTDGIESIAKHIARVVPLSGNYSKAHGKLIWLEAPKAQALMDWQAQPQSGTDGFVTAAGVFSADGVDPASALLAQHLPETLSGQVADLGAGWGYLSASLLARASKLKTLHLIEDNANALACARQNVRDARAQFHWGDALSWHAPDAMDAVIMNPPFHTGRSAEPSLGIGFIKSAARILRPAGRLYMVANAHLPYEPALEESFAKVECIARDTRFKVFCAERGRDKLR